MDSHVGLDYIVENPDYCTKLASALNTANTSVKKQVIELLSALCVYSQDGRQRTIDTIHIYQELKQERYRFRMIVDELQNSTSDDYRTALLAFVNCLIISTPILRDRIRIRSEFIGLKLLTILNDLRKESSRVPDLRVQLDVFDEQRESDEEQSLQGPPGIDLSSHLDVFYAILKQIADTPHEIPFLSILQHLLRLDSKEASSDLAWDTAETLVHRATLLENKEDATKLLRSPSLQTNLRCWSRGTHDDHLCPNSLKTSAMPLPSTPTPPPPPPPPPPISKDSYFPVIGNVVPPPPPPPPQFATSNATTTESPPINLNDTRYGTPNRRANTTTNGDYENYDDRRTVPPMPPPLNVSQIPSRTETSNPSRYNAKLLPQQEIPTPKIKMKTINWNKIPNDKVIGKRNVWAVVANDHQNSPMPDLDWAEMEGLFCQQVPSFLPSTMSASSVLYSTTTTTVNNEADKRRREPSEITLFDGKRSLNVNIFLKQFRSSNEDIIRLIREGGHEDIGAEKLRGLLKILPEIDELEMLKCFDGDRSKLGNAEKFFLQLIQVPSFKLRIECMLLKEEFAVNMGYLRPSINSMILAGEDLMTNKPLQEVLYMVLIAGNFLNSGGYAGNAAGVKLSSLQKLTEIRANKPGMNLIHYVALQVEKKRKDLLSFSNDMKALEAATRTTVEQLNNEFNSLDTKIKNIKNQLDIPTTDRDIRDQMASFLQIAEREMSALKRDIEELEGVRRSLAEFFCEDINTFKLEECFRIFQQFCQRFKQAIAENERRRTQEEQALARRRQREQQLSTKKRLLSNQAEVPASESETNIIDSLLHDIHAGFPLKINRAHDIKMRKLQNGGVNSEEDVSLNGSPNIRCRLGSCSEGPDQLAKEDTYSPDITPTGSLRRRRSRVPSEEDEGGNLMDFLRTSGHDTARDRKSWGSLDRSWARRARGQPRRGDLLNADFSGDRERPSSPSPLVENKPLVVQEEEVKPTEKAWRQKIEAWLSENEKEERAGEELQRRARQLQLNRRSFEDSGSEGKSSTMNVLFEEKSPHPDYSGSYYSDWRPTVEETDVIRTMEAIEGAQQQSIHNKDKSLWRKSNLNASNSSEETDPRYLKRFNWKASTENVLGPGTLQAIREEERKKSIINPGGNFEAPSDLTIYIRQPYCPSPKLVPVAQRSTGLESKENSKPEPKLEPELESQGKVTRKSSKNSNSIVETKVSDKIEIDSDNIETPPATRRVFSPPREVKPVEKEPCRRERCNGSSFQLRESKVPQLRIANTATGDPFDRYSTTRRTRRYKKSPELVPHAHKDSSSSPGLANVNTREESSLPTIDKPRRPNTLDLSPRESKPDDSDPLLRIWQNRLKLRTSLKKYDEIDDALRDIANSGEDLERLSDTVNVSKQAYGTTPVAQPAPIIPVTNTVLSPVMQETRPREPSVIVVDKARAIPNRERNRSMIDPSQVKEALRISSAEAEACLAPTVTTANNEDLDLRRRGRISDTKLDTTSLVVGVENNSEPPMDHRYPRSRRITPPSRTNRHAEHQHRAKVKAEQEFCDEGFEETQSLVSETPSQGTSSGNYETDAQDSNAANETKSLSIGINDGRDDKLSDKTSKLQCYVRRTGSLRPRGDKTTRYPSKRTESLERGVMPRQKNSRNEVERSSSRSSLRSSRSSLNSSTSVNTVRNMRPRPRSQPQQQPEPTSTHQPSRHQLGGYTSAIRALTSSLRRSPSAPASAPPLPPLPLLPNNARGQHSNRRTIPNAIPASRSSSSGSSIVPTARNVQKSGMHQQTKTNTVRNRQITSRSSSSGSSIDPQTQQNHNQHHSNNTTNDKVSGSATTRSRLVQPRASHGHSFMRPTAASVNKGSISNLPKSIRTSNK